MVNSTLTLEKLTRVWSIHYLAILENIECLGSLSGGKFLQSGQNRVEPRIQRLEALPPAHSDSQEQE